MLFWINSKSETWGGSVALVSVLSLHSLSDLYSTRNDLLTNMTHNLNINNLCSPTANKLKSIDAEREIYEMLSLVWSHATGINAECGLTIFCNKQGLSCVAAYVVP